MPASLPTTYEIIADVIARNTTEHFRSAHPFLSMIILAEDQIPQSVVLSDVNSFFKANSGSGASYPYANAIRLSVGHLKAALDVQLPKVIFYFRLILAGLFAIPFHLTLMAISIAAYSDIKVHRAYA